jgi:hypothetical protein
MLIILKIIVLGVEVFNLQLLPILLMLKSFKFLVIIIVYEYHKTYLKYSVLKNTKLKVV